MKVLIACEYSGRVRDAFRDKGHDAYSCDILPSEGREEYNQYHIQDDVLKVIEDGWDMMIAFPPCTYLTNAANGWLKNPGRLEKRQEAAQFFLRLYNAPIERVALENPVGYMNSSFRKPDQIFHPYFFGDAAVKRTCLWLRNLPKLVYLDNPVKPEPLSVVKRKDGSNRNLYYVDKMHISDDRAKLRSLTFPSVAKAMADAWG